MTENYEEVSRQADVTSMHLKSASVDTLCFFETLEIPSVGNGLILVVEEIAPILASKHALWLC
jgi:hypothetical protein